ncbi:hypothetical protein K8S19_01565 [bacterium]|nr:hypothetical protein [bacterium]
MDVKEVKRRRVFKNKTTVAKKEIARPWRQWVPYFFMGTVFVLGFLALILVIHSKLALAGRIILAAMVFAGAEYYFRKISNGPSSMEDEFSTLSDIFCFAIVPSLMIYQLAFRGWGVLGLLGLFLVIFTALIRLSLYKLYNPIHVKHGFIGIPVTITAAFIALVAQIFVPVDMTALNRVALLSALIVLNFLTVSTIPYPNPTDRPAIVIVATILVMAVFLQPPVSVWAVWALLCGGTIYIILAPIRSRKGGRNHA